MSSRAPGGAKPSDEYLVERIREAIASDPRVNELELQVTVAGEKVFVSGTVATAERRDAIGEVLAAVAPNHEIHNETSVIPLSPEPEVEELS